MPYYLNDENITLDALKARIMNTDLVPSRAALLDGIDDKFRTIKDVGIRTLSALRMEVKTSKKLKAFAERTGLDADFLVLLRREVEGYFPKAFPLSDFTWLDGEKLGILTMSGYKNTATLFKAIETEGSDAVFTAVSGDNAFINELTALVGLTRIQWVSPLTAKMLFEAGCKDVEAVASADTGKLSEALDRVNTQRQYFKGRIGLRDIKRLVTAASYVQNM